MAENPDLHVCQHDSDVLPPRFRAHLEQLRAKLKDRQARMPPATVDALYTEARAIGKDVQAHQTRKPPAPDPDDLFGDLPEHQQGGAA